MNSIQIKNAKAMVAKYRKYGIHLFESDARHLAKYGIWAWDLVRKN